MSAMEIPIGSYQSLGFDLPAEVDAYSRAMAEHALTVDVPAPMAHGVVERIVRDHGGEFVIVPDPGMFDEQPLPRDPKYYKGFSDPKTFFGRTLREIEAETEAGRIARETRAVEAALAATEAAAAQDRVERAAWLAAEEQHAAEFHDQQQAAVLAGEPLPEPPPPNWPYQEEAIPPDPGGVKPA